MTAPPQLEELRRNIDALDDAMQDLLLERVALVEQVARIKDGAIATRPVREAEILRRLAQRHRGAFPLGSLFRIWREIIASNLQLQQRFRVSLWQGEGHPDLGNLARDFYGFSIPVTAESDANIILDEAEADPLLFGVLPLPDGSPAGRWWMDLARREGGLAIIGCLPFLLQEDEARALVVASVPFAPSGADTSLLAWSLGKDMDAEEAAGFATGLEVNIKLLDSDGRGLLLLAVEGYMDGSEESLASLRQHGTLKPLGGYANPWREGDSS